MAERALSLQKQRSDYDESSAQILKLQQRIAKANAHNISISKEEQRECRIKLMKALPRYRPKM
jgi:hypothetical protein